MYSAIQYKVIYEAEDTLDTVYTYEMKQPYSQQHRSQLLELNKIIKAVMSHAKIFSAWRGLSMPLDTYDDCLLIIGLPSYNTEML